MDYNKQIYKRRTGGNTRSTIMKINIENYPDVEDPAERTVEIRIDEWDTWSMDHTLALIILPMLKQLKETTNGAPYVDDEDVPENLRSTSAPPTENEWDTDDYHFDRWDWVLDEMIYAFEHIINDDWERFIIEDKKQFEVMNNRLQNGLNLFAKYYRGLWD